MKNRSGWKYDVVFPIIHGTQGEDGTVQGLFELAGARNSRMPRGNIRAVHGQGDDQNRSSRCRNRHGEGRYRSQARMELSRSEERLIAHIERNLPYPVFVKPSRAGSSVGVSKAHGRDELCAAFDAAFEWDDKVLCEEYIEGREIECGLHRARRHGHRIRAGRDRPRKRFYDYDTKYKNDNASYYIPARLGFGGHGERYAVRLAASALGSRGFLRIDFFRRRRRRNRAHEVNTMPGFTPISSIPS